MLNIISAIFIITGAFFFFSGTLGIIRFPDIYSRLHALCKADNLGLGFISLGLILQSDSVFGGLKILLIWIFALISSATVSFLISNTSYLNNIPYQEKK